MGMPVYNADYAGTYANEQVAVLNNPAVTLKVSHLRYYMMEIIANLPNIPDSQRSGLQNGLIELFGWLPKEGKYVMAAEIDAGCNSLRMSDINFLEKVITVGLEHSTNLTERQKKLFDNTYSNNLLNEMMQKLSLKEAELALSDANYKYEVALRICREKQDALEDVQSEAEAAAREKATDKAIGAAILGGGASLALTGLACIACPALIPAAVGTRVAIGVGTVATASSISAYQGYGYGYSYEYAQHKERIADAQLELTDARIERDAAISAVERAKELMPSAAGDIVLRKGIKS